MPDDRLTVYFSHIPHRTPEARFRDDLARGCLRRWLLDSQADVVLLQPAGTAPLLEPTSDSSLGVEPRASFRFVASGAVEMFHQTRYALSQAEARARGADWHVVADDDCLPLGRDFVSRARAALRNCDGFGVVAASGVHDATGAGVVEAHAVGGVCFVSHRCPSLELSAAVNQFDLARYEPPERRAPRGLPRRCRINHLGHGFSTAEQSWWFVP